MRKCFVALLCLCTMGFVVGCSDSDDDNKGCKDGEIQCISLSGINGSIAYLTCKDGKWPKEEDYNRCENGLVCEAKKGCVTNTNRECNEGDVKCVDETVYQVCNVATGFWSTGVGECQPTEKCDKTAKRCVPKN